MKAIDALLKVARTKRAAEPGGLLGSGYSYSDLYFGRQRPKTNFTMPAFKLLWDKIRGVKPKPSPRFYATVSYKGNTPTGNPFTGSSARVGYSPAQARHNVLYGGVVSPGFQPNTTVAPAAVKQFPSNQLPINSSFEPTKL